MAYSERAIVANRKIESEYTYETQGYSDGRRLIAGRNRLGRWKNPSDASARVHACD